MIDIYSFIVNHAELSKTHRQELNVKRGFSDATIDKARFVSSGQYMAGLEDDLIKTFREEDLVLSGAFIHDGKTARINPMLLEDRVLIPYANEDGQIYFLRPHKLGLRGVPVEVYQRANLSGNPAEVVLTEGEFKAVAGMQYGIPTISVPGISSFSESNFPRLMELLNKFSVKRVVIMFDNETKDDPSIEARYKDNPSDRYDTPFYAYYMATRIEREGKEVAIAQLPESWKIQGKIDLDGAAAAGKTSGELRSIVYSAKPRNEYLNDLQKEAKEIVLRKSAQKRHRSSIRREFNRYVASRTRGKTSWDETISNFIIRIVATHDTLEGISREIEFINEFGKRSGSFSMGSEEMSSPDGFRTFCMRRGDFVWRGTLEDLLTIWESEFLMMDEGRYIVESDCVGWVESEKIWMFGNVAVDADGKELRPDKNGIYWLEKRGVKPIPISMSTGKNAIAEGIPKMWTKEFDASEVKKRLSETIGKPEASVVIGWVSAIPFMEEVFALYGCFPFLFVTGRWQSGKSTIADWIMNFFGVENAGKTISQTTSVAIQRSLSYYSCMPVYLDEFRNTKEIVSKAGFLRNVYNRQSSGKGTKLDFGLREAKVRGSLVIAGEETPKDGALLSRCIVVFVSRQKREQNHFTWFMANRMRFSGHSMSLLRRKSALTKQFVETLNEWRDFFTKNEIDDRTAINYAIVIAGYATAFDKDLDFADWLMSHTKQVQIESSEEQAVSVFLDDLLALKTQRMVDDNYWIVSGGKIYLYFHGLHQRWSENFRRTRGEEAFKEGSIRNYLKEESGFLEINAAYRIKGQMKKCIVFDQNLAPDDIKHLVEDVSVSAIV